MQCIKMLNLLVLKLIKHLTTISKGLRWGTKSLFLFLLLLRDQLSFTIIHHGGRGGGCGGVLEDQTIFRGKGGGISCRRQSLKGGNYRN